MTTQSPEPVVVAPREPVAWRMVMPNGHLSALQSKPFHEGFAKMMADDLGCRVEPLYAAAPASPDPLPPRCQRCGGEIHGWCCQSCPAEFREDDSGNLIFDEGSPDPLLEEAAYWLTGMCDAYELLCQQSGMNYHESASSKYARARAFLAKLGRA